MFYIKSIYFYFKSIFYRLFLDFCDGFPTGLTLFCGRQGSGKTISAIRYLEGLKNDYNFLLFSNIFCSFADAKIEDLSDIFKCIDENRGKNIVFLIDEIQNTFSSRNKKGLNEDILRLICQQRKQKIHIVATSQVFTSVSKPLREQTNIVVNCMTKFARQTFNFWFFADDYNLYYDVTAPKKMEKLKPFNKEVFFQEDELRKKYDTFEIVNSLIDYTKE